MTFNDPLGRSRVKKDVSRTSAIVEQLHTQSSAIYMVTAISFFRCTVVPAHAIMKVAYYL